MSDFLPARLGAVTLAAVLLAACGQGDEDAAGAGATTSAAASPEATASASPSDALSTAATPPARGSEDAGVAATPPPGETSEITAAAPAFPADTSPDEGEPAGDVIGVQDVRTGVHDGFDRVVFDIAGDGVAGWRVRYVDQPSQQGSGNPVELAGEAALEVVLFPSAFPPDAPGMVYDGPERISVDGAAVTEVVDDKVFEGQHVFHVGVDRERPFRVFRLDDPQRVVLDVRTG